MFKSFIFPRKRLPRLIKSLKLSMLKPSRHKKDLFNTENILKIEYGQLFTSIDVFSLDGMRSAANLSHQKGAFQSFPLFLIYILSVTLFQPNVVLPAALHCLTGSSNCWCYPSGFIAGYWGKNKETNKIILKKFFFKRNTVCWQWLAQLSGAGRLRTINIF